MTPTGAAIVKTLVKRFTQFPAMTIEQLAMVQVAATFRVKPTWCGLTIGEVARRYAEKQPRRKPFRCWKRTSTT